MEVLGCVGYSIPMGKDVQKCNWKSSLCEMHGMFICEGQGCDPKAKG